MHLPFVAFNILYLQVDFELMRKNLTRLVVTLLMLSALLLVGCTAGLQDLPQSSPSITPSKPATILPGPGVWPTGMPAPPLPTITPGSPSAVSTAPSQGTGPAEALPPTIPSTNTVATSTAPGWTTYESINDIHDLAFAPDGTLWATTLGGLVHWDLKTQTYVRYSIPAWTLALAPDGTLWLALEQGVCHFDGASCEIHSKADGLMGDEVYTIVVAPDGSVWMGTEQGVSCFDGDAWKSYPSPVATHDLAVTASGEVWAATAGGVGRYLPAEDGWITYTEDHGLPSSNTQTIAAGPDGEIWAYLVWQGVYRFDSAGWQKVEGVDGSIFDMAFAIDGTPWIATTGSMHYPGGSLSYHDGNQWHNVAGDPKLHSFTSVALGPGGIVAASTQLGLGLYEGGAWHLLRDGPTSHRVTSVAVTPDGAAWFAFGDHSVSTPGWGLSRFDGQEWDYFLDDAEVNALAVGPDGALWAGVGCSVQRFDGTAWEIIAHCEDLPDGNVLNIDFAPDGTAWVVNYFGLARFDGASWVVYERLVHSLVIAPDGTAWVKGWEGTQNSLYIAHFDGETWTTFESADSFPGGFSVDVVTPDGLLWGTTPKGKLASFDGQSRQTSQAWTDDDSWTFYEPPAGLQDHVAPLVVAPDGALWLATDSAIARFDRESAPDEAWTLYTQDEGLPDSYYRAMAFGPGGEIWFGATRFQSEP